MQSFFRSIFRPLRIELSEQCETLLLHAIRSISWHALKLWRPGCRSCWCSGRGPCGLCGGADTCRGDIYRLNSQQTAARSGVSGPNEAGRAAALTAAHVMAENWIGEAPSAFLVSVRSLLTLGQLGQEASEEAALVAWRVGLTQGRLQGQFLGQGV